jgi:predicted nuclease of restriction endonuclease-like (RecB) superfamily
MNIKNLAELLKSTSQFFKARAINAVNSSLTLRNWLFGYYIVEYEQKGEDRAKYGDRLLEEISAKIENQVDGTSITNLRLYRQFYQIYPSIGSSIPQFVPVKSISEIHQTVSDESNGIPQNLIRQTLSDELTILTQKGKTNITSERIIRSLSFSHITELIKITDMTKRAFYEFEAINGTWSVRELRRQIATLYFERSDLSKNKEKLDALVNLKTEKFNPSDILKNPYTFEFLGLPNKEILHESELEQALIDNLQQFLVELGNGFCFEARQKRILIGDEYFFIDLVFYHRILKCHILIDLKVNEFSHSDAGQLNAYLNYFKKEIKQKSDRNPVGILLCTGSNNTLVKYATAGMSKNLFVSQYLINLPTEQELKEFVDRKILELK